MQFSLWYIFLTHPVCCAQCDYSYRLRYIHTCVSLRILSVFFVCSEMFYLSAVSILFSDSVNTSCHYNYLISRFCFTQDVTYVVHLVTSDKVVQNMERMSVCNQKEHEDH